MKESQESEVGNGTRGRRGGQRMCVNLSGTKEDYISTKRENKWCCLKLRRYYG